MLDIACSEAYDFVSLINYIFDMKYDKTLIDKFFFKYFLFYPSFHNTSSLILHFFFSKRQSQCFASQSSMPTKKATQDFFWVMQPKMLTKHLHIYYQQVFMNLNVSETLNGGAVRIDQRLQYIQATHCRDKLYAIMLIENAIIMAYKTNTKGKKAIKSYNVVSKLL